MSEYFSEPKSSGEKTKVELDLSKKVGLAHIKSNVDKLNVDNLKNVPKV